MECTAGARIPRNRLTGGRRIAVRSPVAVVVTNGDKSVGVYSDGSFINDFGSNIEGYITKEDDRTFQADYNLPDDTYGVVMTATGSGDVHVYAGTDGGEVIVFDTITVSPGDQLVLGWEEADTTPRLADADAQEVASTVLTDLEPAVVVIDDVENLMSPQSESINSWGWISVGLAILVILFITIILVVLVIILVVAARKRKQRG